MQPIPEPTENAAGSALEQSQNFISEISKKAQKTCDARQELPRRTSAARP
jgi:hypothetical protein